MGIMVALSGLDGSGKTSQSNQLALMCREYGYSVNVIQLKNVKAIPYLYKVKRIMGQYRICHEMSEDERYNLGCAFLFQEKVNDIVMNSVETHDVTILDRYIDSGKCYHYLKDGLYSSVRKIYEYLPQADVNAFLDLSPEACYARIKKREKQSVYESLVYLRKAYEFYNSEKDRFSWINAAKPIDEITHVLFSKVNIQMEHHGVIH